MGKIFFYSFIFTLFLTKDIISQKLNTVTYNMVDRNGFSFQGQLIVKGENSIFKTLDTRKDGSQQGIQNSEQTYKHYNDSWSKIFQYNKKELIIRVPIYGSSIAYNFPLDSIQIELTSEKKIIDEYNCQKAVVSKGNRKYNVWFTLDILGNFAPFGLNKIPGTIIEVTNQDPQFLIKLTKIVNTINESEYNKLYNFIKKQKVLKYEKYTTKITSILCNTKKQNYVIAAEYGAVVNYPEDQNSFTNHIVDIPQGTVKALQQITQ